MSRPAQKNPFEGSPPFERPWQVRPKWGIPFASWRAIKFIVGSSSVITAGVALYFAAVYAHDEWLFPYEDEYEMLRELGAGMSVEYFDEVLGPPSMTWEASIGIASEELGTARTYIESEFLVRTLADSSGQTIMYLVFTCNNEFQPSFVSPLFSTVTLWSTPLDQADESDRPPEVVGHIDLATASTPIVYAEAGTVDASGATRYRAYGYGVSAACTSADSLQTPTGAPLDGYWGAPQDAPESIKQFRSSAQPNFYVETAGGWPLYEENLLLSTAPARVDLPAWFLSQTE
jgi:hypothetical protein